MAMQKKTETQTAYRGVPVKRLIRVQIVEAGNSLSREKAKTVRASACYMASISNSSAAKKLWDTIAYQGCKAHKLDDDEPEDSEGDTAGLPKTIVKYLGNGLIEGALQDLIGVALTSH